MAKILVVEDDAMLNELVRRNLALVGHSCESTLSGGEALARLEMST